MGGRYVIRIAPSAQKALLRLPEPHRERVRLAIRVLADEPRPSGSLLISGGRRRTWRIRVGDYRVIYEIHDDQLLVLVIRIGQRREVYRLR
ncbi:MAG: type II toxin-antitoxin system RelE family toxin [Candidatus Limnocylindrales bacterium]